MAITSVDAGERVLSNVPGAPADEVWVYQCGNPVQLSATQAGIFCNIRRSGVPAIDLEVGNDLIVFDDPGRVDARWATPINRGRVVKHPRTGADKLLSVYMVSGGFVPVGAKDEAGRPHPHAGTGFGVTTAIGYDTDLATVPKDVRAQCDPLKLINLQQYRFDGTTFTITDDQMIDPHDLLPGWSIRKGLSGAIPEGHDLLSPCVATAHGDEASCAGISRWQRRDETWRITNFTPITARDGSFEPTLLRDTDGSLLFTARGPSGGTKPIVLWRSADGGESWEKLIDSPDARAGSSPVTLSRALDGTPFIISHPPEAAQHHARESLHIWPISDDRRTLLPSLSVRECAVSFRDVDTENIWSADNAVGRVVRMADGQWYSLLVYRVAHANEIVKAVPVTPVTGCYLGKVFSDGPVVPTWDFE